MTDISFVSDGPGPVRCETYSAEGSGFLVSYNPSGWRDGGLFWLDGPGVAKAFAIDAMLAGLTVTLDGRELMIQPKEATMTNAACNNCGNTLNDGSDVCDQCGGAFVSPPDKVTTPTLWTVIVTRDITESCVLTVLAKDEDEAREAALEMLPTVEDPAWAVDDGSAMNADPYVTDVSPADRFYAERLNARCPWVVFDRATLGPDGEATQIGTIYHAPSVQAVLDALNGRKG